MDLIEEIQVETAQGRYPASHGDTDRADFIVFTVTEPPGEDHPYYIATRDGEAVHLHGLGGYFKFAPTGKRAAIRYIGMAPDMGLKPEVQDKVLVPTGTERATTVWSTPEHYLNAVRLLTGSPCG